MISPLEFLTPVVPRLATQDEKKNHEWENKPKKCHEPIKKANEGVLLLNFSKIKEAIFRLMFF